jgi:methylmalonyl-CoA/ethylmalonyl-CoA epimerase
LRTVFDAGHLTIMSTLEFWHDHAGVSVPNLDDAIAWYRDVLGFKLERRLSIASIPAEVAVMINGNLRMEIFQPDGGRHPSETRSIPDEDVRTYGNKHTCFGVDDVFAVGEALKQRGADIVWIKKLPFGANIFLRDNAGNLIEFVQRVRPSSAPAAL